MLRTLLALAAAWPLAAAAQDNPGAKPKQTKAPAKAAAKAPQKKVDRLPPTHADVAYGPHARNKLDFWQAKSDQPTALVLYIHGGGWVNGDKNGLSRGGVQPFLDAGISVAAINYRMIQHGEEEKVVPPVKAPLHDAARALQFLRSKAKEWNLDKARVGATGGSAGACTSLWLAFHDDLADPNHADPVLRESSRLKCAAVNGAQTSLDPKQVKSWIANANYGAHAFGVKAGDGGRPNSFAKALEVRDTLLPWIKEYSPIELVSKDDPPVFLEYGANAPPPPGQTTKDATHSSVYGIKLLERMKEVGVAGQVNWKGAPPGQHKSINEFLIATLKP